VLAEKRITDAAGEEYEQADAAENDADDPDDNAFTSKPLYFRPQLSNIDDTHDNSQGRDKKGENIPKELWF